MAAQGDAMTAVEQAHAGAGRRRGSLSPELIAILAVGVTLAGVMLTMMMMMTDSFARELRAVRGEMGGIREEVRVLREEVRVLQAGQVELRERVARVEAKVDVLAGDGPPDRSSGTAG